MQRKLIIGAVELRVNLPQRPSSGLSQLMQQAIIAQSKARAAEVKTVLRSPKLRELDVLVFPGWTLWGSAPPAWVSQWAGQRVITIEMLLPGARGTSKAFHKANDDDSDLPWRGFVVTNKGSMISDVEQLIVTGSDATRYPTYVTSVITQLRNKEDPHRTFSHPKLGDVGLMVCGEVNIARIRQARVIRPKNFPSELNLILNPAHTPGRLEAMRKKRSSLSQKRVLVSTANTHSYWTLRHKNGVVRRNPRNIAAECFQNGQRLRRTTDVPIGAVNVAIFEIG